MSSLRSIPAATVAVAVALVAAPAAHASARYGPAMTAAQIRSMQAQGVREIIVKRGPGLAWAEEAKLRTGAGISYVGPGPLPNTELDRAPAGRLGAAVAALRQDPQVQYAEPDGEVHAAGVPNDTYFGDQWALSNTGQVLGGFPGTPGDDIGATYAWPHSLGSGVTVAEVDTGVDATAPDLQGQLATGASFLNGVQGTSTQDQNGHGTHVAGIIAAVQNNSQGVSGVAPGAQVLPLRVLDANGSGSIDDVAAAFAYAGQHNMPIVNASLGGSSTSQTLTDAVTSNPNTLYVVAAGNGDPNNNIGYDVDTTPFYPCDISATNLICVGASDQNDQPAYFSNYGASNVDLFAPGVNILSTVPGGYAYEDGTSMATPMVSGTLALMLARSPSLNAAQLRSDLLASVDQESQLDGLSVSGGELDAAAAVATAGGDAPYGAPGNRQLPEVSGETAVGSTLAVTPGIWSRGPTGYAYQWQRCVLGACLPIAGGGGTSYRVTAADAGANLDVVVTASNAAGPAQARSATVAVPGPAPSPQSLAPPAGSGTTPASASITAIPTTHTVDHPLRLSHVALTGRRGSRRGRALVFTLSIRARVELTMARTGRIARGGHRGVFRRAVSAHQGQDRYSLSSLLRGRRLAPGRYALTVRAGNRTVTLKLTL